MVSARAFNTGWLGVFPVEVRYAALLALAFLIALNFNQWMAGNLLFPLLTIVAIATLVLLTPKLTHYDRREALRDSISLLSIQIITLLAIFATFQMHRYWLLEGPNHDSLLYYEGLLWATESRLFVSNEAARALWGLGACLENGPWIGFNCPLYRGGTYTVAAWAQYFAPEISGNSLYLVAAYATTIAWFAVRLLPASIIGQVSRLRIGGLALAMAFSTGIIGALVNSNLGTLLGASAFLPIISLALRKDLTPKTRFGLMAIWCAVAVHLYAESVFYAGLFVSLLFLLEFPSHLRVLRFGGMIGLGGLMLFIVFGLGNIALGHAFASLFLFNEIPKGGAWFSWYLHQPPILWIGSFVAGILVGADKPSILIVIVATIITLFAAGTLLYSRQTRSVVLALIGTSFLAVLYVEMNSYQYGEHKVVHLLGPAWALVLVVGALQLLRLTDSLDYGKVRLPKAKAAGWVILLCLVLIFVNFFTNAFSLLRGLRAPHALDFGLTTLAAYVRPGERVLVDDTAWISIEKYYKTHHLIFQIHHQGAEALLPSIDSDHLRGGYFRRNRNDTFSRADSVDWLVQSRGSWLPSPKLVASAATLVWENANYRLYRVGNRPVAAAGNGWYECEPGHCWTVVPFEIETLVPQGGRYQLVINFELFLPPAGGTITVRSQDGQVLAKASSPPEQLHIELPAGWSRLIFDNDWPITSPLEAGISTDNRRLFAAVRRVDIIPLHEQTDK